LTEFSHLRTEDKERKRRKAGNCRKRTYLKQWLDEFRSCQFDACEEYGTQSHEIM
jgi:hypothetical protein